MLTTSIPGFGGVVYVSGESFSEEAIISLHNEILRLEQKFSRFVTDSALNILNKKLHKESVIDTEFFELLTMAKELELSTDGSFNIATKSLLSSWGYDENYNLGHSYDFDFSGKSFELNTKNQTVLLYNEIDFGSFGKGYFLDQVKKCLTPFGIENYQINAGGDLVISNYLQKIYFEDPRNKKLVIGEAHVNNLFMASSSPLRRQWNEKHHLVDPLAKKPADEMLGVYVQSQVSGAWTDAVSTALFAMGFERAKKFLLSVDNVQALLISEKGMIWKSDKFVGDLYKNSTL